jgi:hypothetical protein
MEVRGGDLKVIILCRPSHGALTGGNMGYSWILPSGKLTYSAENCYLYMIYPCNMVIFNSYVKLPEGMCINGVIIIGFLWDIMRYSCGYLCYLTSGFLNMNGIKSRF